jgi:hypothetical protein
VSRYRFIADHLDVWPIPLMIDVLEVSRSGFYAWRERRPSARDRRRAEIADAVTEIFHEHRGIPGSRKVAVELLERELAACRNTVARIMREEGLESRAQRRRSRAAKPTGTGAAGPQTDEEGSAEACFQRSLRIGLTGFEPATSTPPVWRATKLRYSPYLIVGRRPSRRREADRVGFEPTVRKNRTRHFQCRSFSRSDTCPEQSSVPRCRTRTSRTTQGCRTPPPGVPKDRVAELPGRARGLDVVTTEPPAPRSRRGSWCSTSRAG